MSSPRRRAAAQADQQNLDRAEFARLVREALAHLYDPVYLQTHPLARLLQLGQAPLARSRTLGAALRELILEAIEALRPEPTRTPSGGPSPRGHRLLHLRYVEGLDGPDVRSRLALSRSQYYVEHQRALEALVSLLWERWGSPDRQEAKQVGREAVEASVARVRVLRPSDTPSTNLPHQLTSFVGRDREIAEVKELLRQTRLLTLTGAGGSGKTRLAYQVAEQLFQDRSEDYPDGVWVAELASLADPSLVPQVVASTLGLREVSGQPILDILRSYLKPRRLLLLLDNCEHLLDACAALADSLLKSCPGLKVLATSREALGISGETRYHVPPLLLPDLQDLPRLRELAELESVRLFVERARAVQPSFSLTEGNASLVAEVCWRLDGIPLAIELAAVLIRGLTIEQLAHRLDDRFRLLTGGSRTALRRHRSRRRWRSFGARGTHSASARRCSSWATQPCLTVARNRGGH